MDESKELIGMAVSVLIAVMILSGVMALITLSYSMWNMFSQQDLSNRKMKEYINYASFDDTTIRGQEVVSLISSTHGTPFIVIYENDGATPLAASFDNVSIKFVAQNENYHTSHTNLDSKLGLILGRHGAPIPISDEIYSASERWNFSEATPSMENLQNFFLGRGALPENGGQPRYCGYESCIIYASDSSTDIAGILLREIKPTDA